VDTGTVIGEIEVCQLIRFFYPRGVRIPANAKVKAEAFAETNVVLQVVALEEAAEINGSIVEAILAGNEAEQHVSKGIAGELSRKAGDSVDGAVTMVVRTYAPQVKAELQVMPATDPVDAIGQAEALVRSKCGGFPRKRELGRGETKSAGEAEHLTAKITVVLVRIRRE
jgi:hypothetical protein